MSVSQPLVFRKGLDMKEAVAGELAAAYHSKLVDEVRAAGYRHDKGRLTLHLAREFGFCYGVDRAVDYAYQAVARFPGRNVFLTGEIIHNPHVNDRLRANGIRFLSDADERGRRLGPEDVVILPAFGITVQDMPRFLGAWLHAGRHDLRLGAQRVEERRPLRAGRLHRRHSRQGEARRDACDRVQALKYPRGRYLVVLDREEAAVVCDYIRHGGDRDAFLARFAGAASPGFDPDTDLERVGCANQTTMLMSESLEIGEMFGAAMRDRYGADALPAHFRAFDTICSATQERQDAVERSSTTSARPHDRGRRLQQQQHLQPGADLRGAGAHLPHLGSCVPAVGDRHPSSSRRSAVYREVPMKW